jgi:hypothetical protein
MKITAELAQEEIEEAIKQYISSQSFVAPGMEITVDFVGGRGKTAAMVVLSNTPIDSTKPAKQKSAAVVTAEPVEEKPAPEEKVVENAIPEPEDLTEDFVPDDNLDTDSLFGEEPEDEIIEDTEAGDDELEKILSDEDADSLFA